jgi:Cof subfamily protein (haloacid dehalogenase superfamily)
MKFRELYVKGEVPFDAIFDYTEEWNYSDETCTLREYLGLTPEEEDVWISDSDEALEKLLSRERNRKILFLDLDGTLLNDQKEFTPGNRKAIKEALKAGHQIVISTGRPLVSARVLAKDLGLYGKGCYIISYNGGQIYDTEAEKTIFKQTIPLPYVRYIFDQAKERGLHCQTYDEEGILTEADTPDLQYYIRLTKVNGRVVPDVIEALNGQEPVKMIVIDIKDHEKLEKFREETEDWCQGKMDRVFSSAEYLEHVPPGISKGTAIHFLCDYLGLPLDQTVAAGDAENDLAMIETAAIGCAMANAEPKVKAAADYITKRTNNEDGVSEIIGKFLL